jgi:lipid-A-disaccharide synthase
MLHIGIVAGESSGDQLGGALIAALRERESDIRITAMAGPRMQAAGCESIATADELSVMGLVEVVRQYPRLRRLRERIFEFYAAAKPDVFIGIDVPDFVMNIEARLRRCGVKSVHYVAPQTWAWRPARAAKLAENVDLLLALFPFEVEYFERHGVPTAFVGHPVADQFPLERDTADARAQLGLPAGSRPVAIMPGSRRQELQRHVDLFLDSAALVHAQLGDTVFIANAVNNDAAVYIGQRAAARAPKVPIEVVTGAAHAVLRASDAALVASGTVTMEGLFAKTPLVVAYKLAPLSYFIMKRMVQVPYIAMPNILAGTQLVPEFVQADARPERLAAALVEWLTSTGKVKDYEQQCVRQHRSLKRDAASEAAAQVLALARA